MEKLVAAAGLDVDSDVCWKTGPKHTNFQKRCYCIIVRCVAQTGSLFFSKMTFCPASVRVMTSRFDRKVPRHAAMQRPSRPPPRQHMLMHMCRPSFERSPRAQQDVLWAMAECSVSRALSASDSYRVVTSSCVLCCTQCLWPADAEQPGMMVEFAFDRALVDNALGGCIS